MLGSPFAESVSEDVPNDRTVLIERSFPDVQEGLPSLESGQRVAMEIKVLHSGLILSQAVRLKGMVGIVVNGSELQEALLIVVVELGREVEFSVSREVVVRVGNVLDNVDKLRMLALDIIRDIRGFIEGEGIA